MNNKTLFQLLFCLIIFIVYTNAQASENKFISTKAGLFLRAKPDKTSKIISLLNYGEVVSILKEEGNDIYLDGRYGKWVNVKTKSKNGWVFSGFLCDFSPESIIKIAADYYRKAYSEDENKSQYAGYAKFKDKEIAIVKVIYNYIVLSIPISDNVSIESSRGNVVWEYNSKSKQFFEVYNIGHANTLELLHINKDRYLDMVIEDGCCDHPSLHVLLGSENGFNEIYESKDDCSSDNFFQLSTGNCNALKFTCEKSLKRNNFLRFQSNEIPIIENYNVMKHFYFNCETNKIEMNYQSLIVEAIGVIKDISVSNKSIIIAIDQDDIGKIFHLSEKIVILDSDVNSWEDFKINDHIRYNYESSNEKNTILSISTQLNSGTKSQDGYLLGIDVLKKKIAFARYGYDHVYDLDEVVEFDDPGNRSLDQLKENEKITVYFKNDKIYKIKTEGISLAGLIVSFNEKKRIVRIRTKEGESDYKIAVFASITEKYKNSSISNIEKNKRASFHYIELNKSVKLITSIDIKN